MLCVVCCVLCVVCWLLVAGCCLMFVLCCLLFVFPQQRKLMGSSAQIRPGVRRCGSQEQVPEEGSRRFLRVPVRAGVGSGGGFRTVPEGSGVC